MQNDPRDTILIFIVFILCMAFLYMIVLFSASCGNVGNKEFDDFHRKWDSINLLRDTSSLPNHEPDR